ncbi:MAG: sugar ABC transporter permease [Clostridia bacterium]|nr:sugar ABC transporter permease [Clostridia bacterium]
MTLKLSYKKTRSIMGLVFTSPWIIGFAVFFIQPLTLLFRLAFTDMQIADIGYTLEPLENLFDNFKYALAEDSYFTTHLLSSIGGLAYEVPFIILFSLFTAVILNQQFHGRTFMRVIFFLPVVIGCDLVMNVIQHNSNEITMAAEEVSMFDSSGLVNTLLMVGVPDKIVSIISTMVGGVADLVWDSAIQTLVFLVALLSVPQSYYEVATVEGAKGWETFWKVTFPIVTPYVLALTIYTIIDSFTNVNNKALDYIVQTSNARIEFSKAAAMGWIYFVLIILVILLVFFVFKPFVFEKNSQVKEKRKGRR